MISLKISVILSLSSAIAMLHLLIYKPPHYPIGFLHPYTKRISIYSQIIKKAVVSDKLIPSTGFDSHFRQVQYLLSTIFKPVKGLVIQMPIG